MLALRTLMFVGHTLVSIFAGFGIILSIICFIVLLRIRRASDGSFIPTIFIHLCQSSIDIFIAIIGILTLQRYEHVNFLNCNLITSQSLFLAVICIRIYINICLALFNYIKLLHPFLKIPIRRHVLFSITIFIMLINAILAAFPGVFTVFVQDNVCYINAAYGMANLAKNVLPAIRLIVLMNNVNHTGMPVTCLLFTYKQVLNILKSSNDETRRVAYQELHRNYHYDVWLAIFCLMPVQLCNFFCQYDCSHEVLTWLQANYIFVWLGMIYSVIFPYLSLTERRIYMKPFLDILMALKLQKLSAFLIKIKKTEE